MTKRIITISRELGSYNFYTDQKWKKPVIIRCALTVHSLVALDFLNNRELCTQKLSCHFHFVLYCFIYFFCFHKPITFFVGENGSGKSTLLEAIAVAHGFNPEGGTKN